MAAKKKRLQKLVESVSAILGDEHKAKKLRKAKSLERFIAKMEDKKRELDRKSSKGKEGKERARLSEALAKQIRKAKKILEDLG